MNDQPDVLTIDVSDDNSKEIRAMFRSIERVLPEDLIAEFDGLVQQEDLLQWLYGDKTNDIWSAVSAKKLKNSKGKAYTFLDTCYFVSVRFMHSTRSFNTIKSWALVCRRYSPAVRQLYHYDDVWFAHFAFAAQRKFDVDGRNGQKVWQDILDYSYMQSIKQGYSVSVNQLDSVFGGAKKNKSDFTPATHDFAYGDIDVSPVGVDDIATVEASAETLEGEFAESLHRLGGIVSRISAKYPMISGSVNSAYAILSSALLAIASVKEVTE